MNRKLALLISGTALASVGFGWPEPATASPVVLEEIVVTARKRLETVQDVPVSISAFDSDALTRIGFSNLTDLAEKVPSLSMAPFPNNSSALVVYMRGVGTVDSQQVARDPAVGIYLDDVYLGRAQGLAGDLADIQRVEILRGPQGTLYGRNTIGGAIKFLTAEPTGSFGFNTTLTGGNRDYRRSVTSLNLPEAAGVSAKLTYLMANEGGWVESIGEGMDFGERRKQGHRVALRWKATPRLTVDYAYDASKQDGQSLYQQRAKPGLYPNLTTPISDRRLGTATRRGELPERDDYDIEGHALTVNWELTDRISLKSVSAYRESSARSMHDTFEAFGLPSAFASDTDQDQFSQELLLNGYTEGVDLNYTVGLFYFREQATQQGQSLGNPFALQVYPSDPVNVFRSPTLADLVLNPYAEVENTASAAYGQLTWTPAVFDSRWSVTVGGRYSRDRREIQRTLAGQLYDRGRSSDSSTDPSLTLQYRFTPDAQFYLSRLQGYRTGGYNLSSPAHSAPFKHEQLVTYEAGLKTSWNNRLRANLIVYKSYYDDMQLDFIEPYNYNISTVNAAEAKVRGAELEIRWLPFAALDLGLNYAYMDANIDGEVISPFTGLPLAGVSMPHTPRHKVHASAEYHFGATPWGQPSAWISFSWEDAQTTNGGPGSADQLRPSVGLLDARLTLAQIPTGSAATLSAALWGRNLTDREYPVYTLYGADIYGEPRSYGVEISLNY